MTTPRFEPGDRVAWQTASGFYRSGLVVEVRRHWATVRVGFKVYEVSISRLLPD